MSMPDMEPMPNSYPSSPEEYVDALIALKSLHESYDKSREDDQAREDYRNLSVLQQHVTLEMRPYLQFGVPGDEDSPMTSNYNQMLLRPKPDTMARRKVSEIIARFPHFEDSQQPFDLPEDAERWNDVSLEVKYADGVVGRYWLNTAGLVPYKDADALDFDYPRTLGKADLFAVIPGMEDATARPLSGTDLRMFLRESVVKTQPNNPDEE